MNELKRPHYNAIRTPITTWSDEIPIPTQVSKHAIKIRKARSFLDSQPSHPDSFTSQAVRNTPFYTVLFGGSLPHNNMRFFLCQLSIEMEQGQSVRMKAMGIIHVAGEAPRMEVH